MLTLTYTAGVNNGGNEVLAFDNILLIDGGAAGPDVDLDGDVDGTDFLLIQESDPSLIPDWEAAFGGGSLSAVAVPEPSSLVILLSSAMFLTLLRSFNK